MKETVCHSSEFNNRKYVEINERHIVLCNGQINICLLKVLLQMADDFDSVLLSVDKKLVKISTSYRDVLDS